jgi:CRP/FNR family cyclic AMP-dependent transcriptional regulator
MAKSTFDPASFLATANPGRTVSTFRTDDVIFSQEAAADAIFYIQTGRIKLVITSSQGKEAIVAMLRTGEFFGEGCLIGQPLRLATARAMAESTVMRIEKAEMVRVLHDEPTFGERFITHLLTRISRAEEDLTDHLFNSSEKRLARTLLVLANFGNKGVPQPITMKISHETLAEIVGTTRPRISQFMNKFRRLGFVDYNGHLEVHSSLLSILLRE